MWDSVLENPREITVETLNTGYIAGVRAGMFNVRAEAYSGQCAHKTARLPVLAHLVFREGKHHLVDTGFDASFSEKPHGNFRGLLSPLYFRNRYMQPDAEWGIERQLRARGIELDTIFLTHGHEHAVGLAALGAGIPVVTGMGERDINVFPLVYSTQITSRKNRREIDFEAEGVDMSPLGRCVDVFGDGSFWAVDTRGHTKGHVAYLVNGRERAVLLVGDVSVTALGFSIGVETGVYSENMAEAKRSFDRVKRFAEAYPQVEVVFGHEAVGRFAVAYGAG